jgi:hypothetical protein
MMVYNTQKLDLFLPSGEGGTGDTYSVGSIRKSKPQSLDHTDPVSEMSYSLASFRILDDGQSPKAQ